MLKKLLLKIAENCHESTSIGTYFWIKVDSIAGLLVYSLKRTLRYWCFPANVEMFPTSIRTPFFSLQVNEWKYYSEAILFRGSRSQIFFTISVLKNFAIFTEKHLCWKLYLRLCETHNAFQLPVFSSSSLSSQFSPSRTRDFGIENR